MLGSTANPKASELRNKKGTQLSSRRVKSEVPKAELDSMWGCPSEVNELRNRGTRCSIVYPNVFTGLHWGNNGW